MSGQANTDASHTHAGDQGGHVHPCGAGRGHERESHYQQPQETREKHLHRWLELQLFAAEPALCDFAEPARDEKTCRQDHDRA